MFSLPSDALVSTYTRLTDSGGTLDCYFCSKCGVRIMHVKRGGETTSVKGGVLVGLDWTGVFHIWTCRAVIEIPDGVEKYEREPPNRGEDLFNS